MAERRTRVVIIGAGFGGLAVARHLNHTPVDIEIIDQRNHHTFQPLLYQVATAGLDGDDVCYATRGIFQRQRNVRVRLGTVVDVRLADQTIALEDGSNVAFDYLVVACGAVTNTFGVPGVDQHAFGLKSLADANAVKARILNAFEHADALDGVAPEGLLTVSIVGGGPTGVELAGGVAELFDRVLARDFPRIDMRQARVVLIEATGSLLGTFAEPLQKKALLTLERRGVEVLLSTSVAKVDAAGIRLRDGRSVPCHTTIWAAGVKANPLAERLGVATVQGGRIVVDESLRVPGAPHVFAIGDVAASLGEDGTVLPQVAPVAIQGAAYVAAEIRAALHGEPPGAFGYRDKGAMATIGRHEAVAQLPNGLPLSGAPGWVAWLALHLVMLIGFRNRANVLVNWAWNYLTYDRGSRIITDVE